jgi:hypothetical protein
MDPPLPRTESKEGTRPAVLERNPSSKRKRDHVDHGPELAAGPTEGASEDRDRPGPLKRHKSDQNDEFRKEPTPPAPVTPVVDTSAPSESAKPQKNQRNRGSRARRPKDAKNKDSTGHRGEGELSEAEVDHAPATSRTSGGKRPKSPSRQASRANGKKPKKTSKLVSGHKAASDTESVKSSNSHMFFVDMNPTTDVVYEIPEVKSKYRVEDGDLLIPHNVLLETAEEQQISLSGVDVPPTDDPGSDTEDDFQLIEDINGVCFTFQNVDLLFRVFPVATLF